MMHNLNAALLPVSKKGPSSLKCYVNDVLLCDVLWIRMQMNILVLVNCCRRGMISVTFMIEVCAWL